MSSENIDVVLGVYDKGQGLTAAAEQFVAANFNQAQLQTFLNGKWGSGTVRIIYASTLSAESKYKRIAFVGLGEKQSSETNSVKIEEQFDSVPGELTPSETARSAAAAAVAALKKDDKDTKRIHVDNFDGFDKAAAEGAVLGGYEYAWDKENPLTTNLNSIVVEQLVTGEAKESGAFREGVIAATAQTLAAAFEETPANKLTPTIFANTAKQIFEGLKNENVKVNIYDRAWAQSLGMGSFLSVSQGSEEEPRFLEIVYNGNNKSQATDLVLVGKGITFDTGGISLKPAEKMKEMKGDMGGAATVVASLYAIVQLGVPLNITCVTPLCENMPSGKATKPGDVFTAMNKKTIEVDNTDAEGRLILADALCYASTKSPKVVIDAATLTGAIGIALGGAASGCFTNSNALWKVLQTAGQKTNDYFWRMPLFKNYYLKQMKSNVSHYNNIGGREGGSCSAASFLSEFVDFSKVAHWAHLDIACTALPGFGRSAMTGRPTRALIEAISSLQNQQL